MNTVKIEVKKRDQFGKERVNKYRNQSLIPIELYGKDIKENVSLLVDYKTMSNFLLKGEFGKNTLFSFDLDGKEIKAIPYDIQVHPISKQLLHIDLKTINEKDKIRVKLKLKSKGIPKGVEKGGRLQQKVDIIEVLILPQDIIANVDVDVSGLDLKEQLLIKDLILPASTVVTKYPPEQQIFYVKG
jgi:large subunit ribosomal protein L25